MPCVKVQVHDLDELGFLRGCMHLGESIDNTEKRKEHDGE